MKLSLWGLWLIEWSGDWVITARVIYSLCDLVLISLMRIQTNQSFSWWSQRSGQPPTPGSEISDLWFTESLLLLFVLHFSFLWSFIPHQSWTWDSFFYAGFGFCLYTCVFYTWTNVVENQVGHVQKSLFSNAAHNRTRWAADTAARLRWKRCLDRVQKRGSTRASTAGRFCPWTWKTSLHSGGGTSES